MGGPFALTRGGATVEQAWAQGGIAGLAVAGLVQVALALAGKRSGKSDTAGHVAVATAIERQAVATERLSIVLDGLGQQVATQGEALRRLEVGQAHILAVTGGRHDG